MCLEKSPQSLPPGACAYRTGQGVKQIMPSRGNLCEEGKTLSLVGWDGASWFAHFVPHTAFQMQGSSALLTWTSALAMLAHYSFVGELRYFLQGAESACDAFRECCAVFTRVGIDPQRCETSGNRCFCTRCMQMRDEAEEQTYRRGGHLYAIPTGWCRFGIKVRAPNIDEIFASWAVAFHGTVAESVASIVGEGLRMPSTKQAEERGTYGRSRSPADYGYIYTSPTIVYASLNAYATPLRARGQVFKVVLQVRQKPGTFDIQSETVGYRKRKAGMRMDRLFSNSELEWKTQSPQYVVPYAVLIKACGEELADDYTSARH
eukprot:NODE_6903_length_1627_cov_3.892000.p1 GENE.NODE_6903_length_1627_cov_3.892000~~NODE_6903_length_1627_cov_3.892000.p1  ORF type:complete len:319 (+),score=73.92 NODE_6903_length_1627_cov_3.892000:248-1204(+)